MGRTDGKRERRTKRRTNGARVFLAAVAAAVSCTGRKVVSSTKVWA